MNLLNMRVGSGLDVHALTPGRPLIIGGVKIAHETGLAGHSDADVLCHAIMDALLGAAGLPDIGQLFPDNDPAFKDADSLVLLKQTGALLKENGFLIINLDSVIAAQAPKLAPYKEQMRINIAQALQIEAERVGVKATTTERLGFTGRREGIAATACALIIKKDN